MTTLSSRPAVSVILCTHNPRPDYLRRCLDALASQTLPGSEWELILIDNASAPDRAPRLGSYRHSNARIVVEESLGLTPARLRGIREARGELLVFVDDDNVLEEDYLAGVLRVAVDKPFLGSWSGQCRPEFEEPPPEWTRRYWGSLAIREFSSDAWSNLPRLAETMPLGTGLCVRRSVGLRYLALHESGQRSVQLDRAGESLLSGGDNDLAACACDLGLSVGVVASLRVTHLMPPERLTLPYLARLCEGIHYSGVILDHYRGIATPAPSIARRVVDAVRRLFMSREDATIARAVDRGRLRARQFIISGQHGRKP